METLQVFIKCEKQRGMRAWGSSPLPDHSHPQGPTMAPGTRSRCSVCGRNPVTWVSTAALGGFALPGGRSRAEYQTSDVPVQNTGISAGFPTARPNAHWPKSLYYSPATPCGYGWFLRMLTAFPWCLCEARLAWACLHPLFIQLLETGLCSGLQM